MSQILPELGQKELDVGQILPELGLEKVTVSQNTLKHLH